MNLFVNAVCLCLQAVKLIQYYVFAYMMFECLPAAIYYLNELYQPANNKVSNGG
jgi:hypothetical protein